MENKQSIEKLMSLIEINKAKYNTLKQLRDIELDKSIYDKEYINMVNMYEMICRTHKMKVASIEEEERIDFSNIIQDFNDLASHSIYIDRILACNEKELAILKTLIDLNSLVFQLYVPRKNERSNKINNIFNYFGLNEEKTGIQENVDLINDFMVSDLTSTIMDVLQKEIDNSDSYTKRKQLLEWKYNVLFMFNNVESRFLMTKFSLPEHPKLISDVVIKTAGISEREYLDKLNIPMTGSLESLIKSTVADIYNNGSKLTLLNEIFIKTYINLLSDKEICDSLYINTNLLPGDMDEYQLEEIEKINNIILLTAERADKKDYRKEYYI